MGYQTGANGKVREPQGAPEGPGRHLGPQTEAARLRDELIAWGHLRWWGILLVLLACGAATADDIATAYKLAYEADPVSAYGGIVGLNRTVDAATAEQLKTIFLEAVIAPAFGELHVPVKYATESKPTRAWLRCHGESIRR